MYVRKKQMVAQIWETEHTWACISAHLHVTHAIIPRFGRNVTSYVCACPPQCLCEMRIFRPSNIHFLLNPADENVFRLSQFPPAPTS